MELPFNDILCYVSLFVFGAPTVYFLSKSGFSFEEKKLNVIITYIVAIFLGLLIISGIFGIDTTSMMLGSLFGSFLRYIIYLTLILLCFAIGMYMLIFIISDNKEEIIDNIKSKILKIGEQIKKRNN